MCIEYENIVVFLQVTNKFYCDHLRERLCDKIKLGNTRCNLNKNRFDQFRYRINLH